MRIEPLVDVLDTPKELRFAPIDTVEELDLLVFGGWKGEGTRPTVSNYAELEKLRPKGTFEKVAIFDTELNLIAICDTKEELCEIYD